jgi:hypothetical protein
METTREIHHDNLHIDIEKLFIVDGQEVWAVIECNCFIETQAHNLHIKQIQGIQAEWIEEVKLSSDS